MEEDIDKVDPRNLVELYSLLGLHGKRRNHSVSIIEIEQEYGGDLESAVHYLWSNDRLNFYRQKRRIKLKAGEDEIARELADRIYWEGEHIDDILENGNAPDYLLDPDTSEEFREPIDALDQSPDEEFYTRIIEILSGGRELKPSEVEEDLAVEINFDLEPKLRYLETQEVVLRTENDRYRLQTDNIDDWFFDQNINVKGVLAERNRHRNNPWKP